MYTTRGDQDAFVARESVSESSRLVHFLSETDSPPSAPSFSLPAKRHLNRGSRGEGTQSESLARKARRFHQPALDRSGVDLACCCRALLTPRLKAAFSRLHARSIFIAHRRITCPPQGECK